MTFFINAWLERENPILELRESNTNRLVYHVKGELLSEWLSNGELTATDLNNFEETNEVIRELLLKSISDGAHIESKNCCSVNNVIKFPLKFKRTNRSNVRVNKSNNVIYLFSLLSRRVLNSLNNAIY